jgi:hypothetical protein
MYSDIIIQLNTNTEYHNKWPYDQFYISNFIFENKDKFNIFVPDILNTPDGKVLRHNWFKNPKMYSDIKLLLRNKYSLLIKEPGFDIIKYYDSHPFLNT